MSLMCVGVVVYFCEADAVVVVVVGGGGGAAGKCAAV